MAQLNDTILQYVCRTLHNSSNCSYPALIPDPRSIISPNQFAFSHFLVQAVFGLALCAGLLSNGVVVFVVLRQCWRGKPDVSSLYFVNLAVADILYLVFCVPTTLLAYIDSSWPVGLAVCKLANYMLVVAMETSVMSMMAMGVDRYQAVVRPLQSKRNRTVGRTGRLLLCMWLLNMVMAAPTLYMARLRSIWNKGQLSDLCLDTFDDVIIQRAHTLTVFVIYYCIPLTVIATTYSFLANKLHKSLRLESPNTTHLNHPRRNRKVIRLVLVVVITFTVCWLPLHTVRLLQDFDVLTHTQSMYVIKIAAHTLSFINSVVNPILYSFMSKPFRKSLREAFRCVFNLYSYLRTTDTTNSSWKICPTISPNQAAQNSPSAFELQGNGLVAPEEFV